MLEEGDAESHKTEFFPLCQVTGRWDLQNPCKYEYKLLSLQKICNLECGQNIHENNLLTIPYPCCNCPGGSCLFLWLIMNNNGRPYVCTRCVCVHVVKANACELWTINWTTLRNFCTPVTSIQMRLKNTLVFLVTQACQMCAFDVNISSNMITAGTLEKKTV